MVRIGADVSSIQHKSIVSVSGNEITEILDTVAVEEPLEIAINISEVQLPVIRKNISITMRTPGEDADLALGFLFTEGILVAPAQVDSIQQTDNGITLFLNTSKTIDLSKIERHFYTSSSCGVCGKSSIASIKTVRPKSLKNQIFQVDKDLIKSLPDKLKLKQSTFHNTGGLHAAGIFDLSGKLIDLKEDVGRHNALDKLIGAAFSTNLLPLDNHLLLLSGRASFELIQKAAMAGIQFVMSIGAPSSLAIELAVEFNITLVGFLSKHRYNIYHGAERIKF